MCLNMWDILQSSKDVGYDTLYSGGRLPMFQRKFLLLSSRYLNNEMKVVIK